MDFLELIHNLPQLFIWFVPGYICIAIYRHLSETPDQGFEKSLIKSIVLSYIFQLLAELICLVLRADTSGYVFIVITLSLSVVCTVSFVRFRLTSAFKRLVAFVGKTTGSKSIWYDFFDLNKGTRIRFFAKFNFQEVTVEGDIKYFETCEDGECKIVISNYAIKYKNGNVYRGYEESTMIFNSQCIYGIEAMYGQKK